MRKCLMPSTNSKRGWRAPPFKAGAYDCGADELAWQPRVVEPNDEDVDPKLDES